MINFGGDKDYFYDKINVYYFNIGCVLEIVGKGQKWFNVFFFVFIEGIIKL